MSAPAAFKASYADLKVIKTRKCVQIIFEVPTEHFDAAYEVLGGLPNPAAECWFAIAALNTNQDASSPVHPDAKPQPVSDKPQAGAKRDWRDMPPSQQSALRCNEPIFGAFLKEEYPDEWHETGDATDCVRMICAVASRALLDKPENHANRMLWHNLDSQFQAWKAMERVGA